VLVRAVDEILGTHKVCRGRIDGDRLVFESMKGAGARLRFTWGGFDPAVIIWRNEMVAGDGSRFLIEDYLMVPR
jgi:hypothetical protein